MPASRSNTRLYKLVELIVAIVLGSFFMSAFCAMIALGLSTISGWLGSLVFTQTDIYAITAGKTIDLKINSITDETQGASMFTANEYEISLVASNNIFDINAVFGMKKRQHKVEYWYKQMADLQQIQLHYLKKETYLWRVMSIAHNGSHIVPVGLPLHYTTRQYCQREHANLESRLQCVCNLRDEQICQITAQDATARAQHTELHLHTSAAVLSHPQVEAYNSQLRQAAYTAMKKGVDMKVTSAVREALGMVERTVVTTVITPNRVRRQFKPQQLSEYPTCSVAGTWDEICETKNVTIKSHQYESMLYIGSAHYQVFNYMFWWLPSMSCTCETLVCPCNTSHVPRWYLHYMTNALPYQTQQLLCESYFSSLPCCQPWFDIIYLIITLGIVYAVLVDSGAPVRYARVVSKQE